MVANWIDFRLIFWLHRSTGTVPRLCSFLRVTVSPAERPAVSEKIFTPVGASLFDLCLNIYKSLDLRYRRCSPVTNEKNSLAVHNSSQVEKTCAKLGQWFFGSKSFLNCWTKEILRTVWVYRYSDAIRHCLLRC